MADAENITTTKRYRDLSGEELRKYRLAYQRKYRAEHRIRLNARQCVYRKANRHKIIVWNRRQRGLPDPTRPCPKLCECCGNPPGKKGFHLDHCHETGLFRGWLCVNCNTAIGKLGDDIPGLMLAIEYLKRASAE